jgi:hypothetical protein
VLSAAAGVVNPGSFNFGISVTDGASTDSDNFSLIVTAPAISIVTAGLPNAQEGNPYGATLQAAGGSGIGYDWTLVSGSLPVGMSGLPGVGQAIGISGTPTTAGPSTFTVRVTDSLGAFAEQTYTLTVDPAGSNGGNGNSGGSDGGTVGGGCEVSVPVSPLKVIGLLGMVTLAVVVTARLRKRNNR